MILNKDTKHYLEIGDVLRFSDGSEYLVTNLWKGQYRNSLSVTIQCLKDRRTIYGEPSSELYGAEIIKGGKKDA